MTTIFDGPHFTFRLLRPNLRRAQRLAREGSPATARIVGIRIRKQTDDSPDLHEWALVVARPGGETFRAGCRQRLGTERLEQLRLGDEVGVLVDDRGRTLIDDGDLAHAELGHKVLKDPPLDGIYDENLDLDKERRRSLAAQVIVHGAERVTAFGMVMLNIRLDVEVRPEGEAPYRTTMKRELVPFYAQHLVAEGTVLPGTARPGRTDKVRVDWPAAAMATPGNGVPPALARTPPDSAPPPVRRRPPRATGPPAASPPTATSASAAGSRSTSGSRCRPGSSAIASSPRARTPTRRSTASLREPGATPRRPGRRR